MGVRRVRQFEVQGPLPQRWPRNCLRLRDLRSPQPQPGVKCLAFPVRKRIGRLLTSHYVRPTLICHVKDN